jgi:hypothetical protein
MECRDCRLCNRPCFEHPWYVTSTFILLLMFNWTASSSIAYILQQLLWLYFDIFGAMFVQGHLKHWHKAVLALEHSLSSWTTWIILELLWQQLLTVDQIRCQLLTSTWNFIFLCQLFLHSPYLLFCSHTHWPSNNWNPGHIFLGTNSSCIMMGQPSSELKP